MQEFALFRDVDELNRSVALFVAFITETLFSPSEKTKDLQASAEITRTELGQSGSPCLDGRNPSDFVVRRNLQTVSNMVCVEQLAEQYLYA